MNKEELLDNIRADFFTEICPFVRPSYITDYEAVKTAFNSVRLVSSFIQSDVLYRCATIVEKNAIEYSLVNLCAKRRKPINYQTRINIRFISSFSASMLTAVVLKSSRNPFSVIVIPFINGTISVTFLLLSNPDETQRFINRNYPNALRFLEKNCYFKEITKFSKQVNDFINRPHMPIHDI